MKLTLRTLLAYLDDTLDAGDIKIIGEKVAESDNAQELVSRLKQVTRRRRLTTPPDVGPGAFDPNEVSEYLDNTLAGERVVELEKQCLESDVHLAEIATCHQILTLVLGEPALVPPKAKERMYKLVAGRESNPYKKAAPGRKPSSGVVENEEELLPGDNWLRWVLPAAGILLVLVLGLAVWQLTRPAGTRPLAGDTKKDAGDKKDGQENKDDSGKKDIAKPDPKKDDAAKKDDGVKKDGPPKEGGTKEGGKKDAGKGDPPTKDGDVPRVKPPSGERAVVGRYLGVKDDDQVAGLPTALAARGPDGWNTIQTDDKVQSSDVLVVPPGMVGLVESGGCLITMRGHVPAYSLMPFMNALLESSVVLHKSDSFDLDVTLRRGRIYLKNVKPRDEEDRTKATPVKARVRFEKEVWDVTLPRKGDEVGLELMKEYPPDADHKAGEEPQARVFLCVMAGDAVVKVDAFQNHSLERDDKATMMMLWDSFTRVTPPQRLPAVPAGWAKRPPTAESVESERQRADIREFGARLKNLEVALKDKKPALAFKEMLSKEDNVSRVLGVLGYGAIGDADALVEILGDDERGRAAVRATAIFVLKHWLAQDPGHSRRLYDAKEDSGVLRKRGYRAGQAETALTLLFDFPVKDRYTVTTFDLLAKLLAHPKPAIAELAFWNLSRLSYPVMLPNGFNAGATEGDRKKYSEAIEDLIKGGKLPPPPPMEKGP